MRTLEIYISNFKTRYLLQLIAGHKVSLNGNQIRKALLYLYLYLIKQLVGSIQTLKLFQFKQSYGFSRKCKSFSCEGAENKTTLLPFTTHFKVYVLIL